MKKIYSFTSILSSVMLICGLQAQAQAPSFTTQPSNDTVCAGTSAMFHVATSDTTARFIWEKSTNGTTWDTVRASSIYTGVTTRMLNVATSDTLSGLMFRAIATNDSGSTISAAATLVVNPLPVAARLSGASMVCISGTTMLTATGATGTWMSGDTSLFTISSTGMVTPRVAGRDTVFYTVTNSCGSAVSWHVLSIDTVLAHASISGPASLCISRSISYSASIAGGNWSATGVLSVTSSGSVMGSGYGNGTLYYIRANGCGADTAMLSVSVDTPINPGTISGASSSCVGSSVAFTATRAGGVWASSNNTVAVPDATGNVIGYNAGTATISYLFTNGCGSSAATATITVYPRASAIMGGDSVGITSSITLSDSAAGGTWSVSDTSIATITSSGVLTGVDTGVVTVTYSVTNVCGTSVVLLNVTVGTVVALDAIGGPDSVCAGSSITLTNSQAGGTWSVTNGATAVSSAGVVTGIIGGRIDTVVYTYTSGFGTASIWKEVKVSTTPPVVTVTGPASVSAGNGYTVTGSPAGGTWVSTNPSKVVFTSPRNGNFYILSADTVDLIYTYTNACGTGKDTFNIRLPRPSRVSVNSVNALENGSLSITPNPSKGNFELNIASATTEDVVVTIYNIAGAAVGTINGSTNKPMATKLNVPAGVYVVKAIKGSDIYTARLVIE